MRHSEIEYQLNPLDVKIQYNYSLFIHFIQHDYGKEACVYKTLCWNEWRTEE